ncbi:MAG: hypothetical protein U1C96_04465 [Gallionella sp.]|nr:hypothetical protein [Gallionella sp.]
MSRETKEADKEVAAPAASGGGMLEKIGSIAMMAIAPLLAMLAIAIALIAVSENRSGQEQMGKLRTQIKELSAAMSESKDELDLLKATTARDKSAWRDEQDTAKAREAEIIRHVTAAETKLKISPTLEQQLQAASAPAATDGQAAIDVPAPESAPPAEAAKPAAKEPAGKPAAKRSPQAQSIKDAIDKYNQ